MQRSNVIAIMMVNMLLCFVATIFLYFYNDYHGIKATPVVVNFDHHHHYLSYITIDLAHCLKSSLLVAVHRSYIPLIFITMVLKAYARLELTNSQLRLLCPIQGDSSGIAFAATHIFNVFNFFAKVVFHSFSIISYSTNSSGFDCCH